jgi:hypothetical protein
MTTANDLIESAALKLGAKATGESLTADEASDCLAVLNSMLDHWATKRLMVYQIVQDSYTWASGNALRTIGTGGNLNGTRPIKIESVLFRDNNNVDYEMRFLRDRNQYDSIPDKTTQSTLPEYVFYDTAYPLGSLYAYPVPSVALTVKINHWQILQNFANLTTDLSLPPGYRWTIEHNLAEALQPVFSMQASPFVIKEAALSKKSLMSVNHVPVVSRTETAAVLNGGRSYNIETGQ